MTDRPQDLPVFTAVYTPPAWPTLPNSGPAFVMRAVFGADDETAGYFAYAGDALGYFPTGSGAMSKDIAFSIADDLATALADGLTTNDARNLIYRHHRFDVEQQMELLDLYAIVGAAWGNA